MLLLLIGGSILALAAVIGDTVDLRESLERASSLHPADGYGDRCDHRCSHRDRCGDELVRLGPVCRCCDLDQPAVGLSRPAGTAP